MQDTIHNFLNVINDEAKLKTIKYSLINTKPSCRIILFIELRIQLYVFMDKYI